MPEVLATMLLLAIVLPVIMNGVHLATNAGDMARRRTEAGTLGDSKLAELVSTGAWNGSGAMSGNFGDDWPDYQWNAVLQDWTAGTQLGLQELDLHVTWNDRGGQQEVLLTTLVYNGVNTGSGPTSGSTSSSSTSSGKSGSGASGTAGKGATK
jgi:hypothetical protein